MATQINSPAQIQLQPEKEAERYLRRNILRSEKMYGDGFQSPGGLDAVEAFCQKLHMWKGMHILEIGSGLGGASFYFARKYGAVVTGLDVSKEMVDISTERVQPSELASISFRQGDIRTTQLEQNAFDLVWTRDCILYIAEKTLVWKHVYASLKPGGQLFITDFCKSGRPLSEDFRSYLTRCQYYLQDLDSYQTALEVSGFHDIRIEDNTQAFKDFLRDEQEDLHNNRERFLLEYNEQDFDYLMNRWEMKIRFCEQGDLKWALCMANK
jgi:phosphoethanolamine N-methyltransferase